MKKKVQKVLVCIFEMGLFCGYFYILFVNLVCGFSYGGGIETRVQAIKILSISFYYLQHFLDSYGISIDGF